MRADQSVQSKDCAGREGGRFSLLDQSKGIAKVEEMGIRLLFLANS